MITEILQYLRNWFRQAVYTGEFSIANGAITGEGLTLADGQYFRIIGSALNDGVWKYGTDTLKDETFNGAVWGLSIPPAVAALADEIADWQTKFGAEVASPYTSESYSRGSYSRSKASGSDKSVTWQSAFADRLSAWRKI